MTVAQTSFKPSNQSEATRFMCASIFLGHNKDIETKLRSCVADPHHAMAENHGLYIGLLARVLDFYNQSTFRYRAWHGILGLLCFLILGISWFTVTPEMQPMTAFLIAAIAVVFGTVSYRRQMRDNYEYPLYYFGRDSFNPEEVMKAFNNNCRKLENKVIPRAIGGNVTIFSGFEPFVGAGTALNNWSLVIDSRKGKEGERPSRFSEQELEDAITSSFGNLPFPGLEITEHLFVHGSDIAAIDGLLPDRFGRPRQNVDEMTMARFRHTESHQARVYKRVAVSSWSDQVRISFFYRIVFSGPMLYIENHIRVLHPLWGGYRKIDDIVPLKANKKVWLFIGHTIVSPFVCFAECISLWMRMRSKTELRQHEKDQKKRIEEQARYNYGATRSLRESFATEIYDHFFEKSDRELYVKAIQKQLLDSIISFLESKNVDTSDLQEQRTYIINSGLIVHGGLHAGAVAVGEEAQANAGTKKPKAKKATVGGKAA